MKRLVAVARGIDTDPLRDRVRSIGTKPAEEAGDELARLAESIDIPAQSPGTLDKLATQLRRVKRSDAAGRLLRRAQSEYPGDFWITFRLAERLAAQDDNEATV